MPHGIFSGSGKPELLSVKFDWIIIPGTLNAFSLSSVREKQQVDSAQVDCQTETKSPKDH